MLSIRYMNESLPSSISPQLESLFDITSTTWSMFSDKISILSVMLSTIWPKDEPNDVAITLLV